MVQVLFSVSTFVEPGTKVAVIGSSPGLGSWLIEHAIPLYPQSKIYSSVLPTTFMNWVMIPEIEIVTPSTSSLELRGRNPIAYKFIRLPPAVPIPQQSPEEALTESIKPFLINGGSCTTFRPVKPRFELVRDFAYEWSCQTADKARLEWEGNGSEDNRYLVSVKLGRGSEIEVESMDVVKTRAIDDRDDRSAPNTLGWIYLPTADFLEPSGVSECTQTTRYYRTVKALRFIHFAKVIDNVFVGSCPRRLSHIGLLRDQLHVGCVFNFQAVEDLLSNWLNETDSEDLRNPATLAEIYADENVSLVHLPTVDMSTPARAAMMAQSAALIMNYLYSNPQKAVYIHCNAGVGRAVAGTLSFLHFVLGMHDREAVAFLKQRRPMAFPDMIAMRRGLIDFNAKYAGAANQLLMQAYSFSIL